MASYLSQPLRVAWQLGPVTYLLQDGSRWHASRLRQVPIPQYTTSVTPQALPLAWQEYSDHQAAPAPTPDIPSADIQSHQLLRIMRHHCLSPLGLPADLPSRALPDSSIMCVLSKNDA